MKRNKILRLLYILLAAALGSVVLFLAMALNSIMGEREAGESLVDSAGQLPDSRIRGSGKLREESLDIQGIKTILYFTDSYEKRPVVILQHGLSSQKEDVAELAAALADAGYLVVTPDAAGHGEARSGDLLSVMDMAVQTADQFDGILRYLQGSRYADTDRTGLVGFSLGGMAAFYYTGNGSATPGVVVSMCSTPDFADLAGQDAAYTCCRDGAVFAASGPEEKKEIDEKLREGSPYGKLLDHTGTSYLMICGDADEVIPYEGNVRFFEAMEDSADDIRLTVKEGQGHTVTEEDMRQVIAYLNSHL